MSNCILKCSALGCGREYALDEDRTVLRLYCDGELEGLHGSALLHAKYSLSQISVRADLPGVFQFADWLPTNGLYFKLPGYELGRPLCYKSERFAHALCLKNLFIAFSGYWPEKGANLITRSFKELEAEVSIGRLLFTYPTSVPPLLVASAGNTANAYSFIGSLLKLPLYLVVPEHALEMMRLPIETTARIVAVRGDYTDVIALSEELMGRLKVQSDGGVRNVGRRAGMGTAYLNAVVNPNQGTGVLFDHYIQAVGSGSGAIAAWEMVQNLISDGRFGQTRTCIHVAQNEPFTPVPDLWEGRGPSTGYPEEESRLRRIGVTAPVLVNRRPAYSIAGGLRDVLESSKGSAWRINNAELFDAAQRFRDTERIEISAAGAVAVGALVKAVMQGAIRRDEMILLHITGGGTPVQYCNEVSYVPSPIGIVAPGAVENAVALIDDYPFTDRSADRFIAVASSTSCPPPH